MIQSHIREQAELEILYFDHETLHGEEMARCTEPLLLVHGLDGRDPNEWVLQTPAVQELIRAISFNTKSLIVLEKKRKERRERIRNYEPEPKIPPKLLETSVGS